MSDREFEGHAGSIAMRIPDLARTDQIAAACRGSGNPVALAWLAENLRLAPATSVVDLGCGLGGPAAWLTERYQCSVVGVDPAVQSARAAHSIFGLATVIAPADATPFAAETFDAALLLGVVSVVADPSTVLTEASRVAPQLGLLDYCATGGRAVSVGGSTFPTVTELRNLVASSWRVVQVADVAVPAPATWQVANDEVHVEVEPDESAVIAAIEQGLIAPVMLVAIR